MDELEWRKNLKVGDKVILCGLHEELREVSEASKLFFTLSGLKFSRKTGRLSKRERFSRLRVIQPTKEIIDRIEHKKLAVEVTGLNFYKLTSEQLRTIAAYFK